MSSLIILYMSNLILQGSFASHYRVCEPCAADTEDALCQELESNVDSFTCQDWGAGDGVTRCFGPGAPYLLDHDTFHSPQCDSDFECLYSDGTVYTEMTTAYSITSRDQRGSCLRCCINPDGAAIEGICMATIGTGDLCGSDGEFVTGLFEQSMAPCCPGQVCLDNIAGICGAQKDQECDECMQWKYLIEDVNTGNMEVITSDNCGDGLICLGASEIEVEQALRRPVRRLALLSFGSSFRHFFGGVCVPEEDGISATVTSCANDKECPGCMRCCDNECRRISPGENCGFDERGPCCGCDKCVNNECHTITMAPTTNPTKKPTNDDNSDDDDDDEGI